MKLTFHGENLAEIHKQILDAADTITRVDVNYSKELFDQLKTDRKVEKSRTASQVKEIEKTGVSPTFPEGLDKHVVYPEEVSKTPITDTLLKQGAREIMGQVNLGIDFAKPDSDKTVAINFPQASFNQAVAQAEEASEPTHIDGNRISNGSVWVPVEGRANAFTGIPMDRYLAQKAAKESGGDLDSKGVAWDTNVHTSTKLKTQSGEWKKRAVRGSKVEAAPVATPTPVFQAPAPPMAQQAVHIPNTTPTWQPATSQPSQPGPAPVVDIPQYEQSSAPIGMAPAGHTYASFKANLNMIMVKLINERKIERDYVKELADYFQVQNIWDVVNDDTKCNELFKSFIENGFITGM